MAETNKSTATKSTPAKATPSAAAPSGQVEPKLDDIDQAEKGNSTDAGNLAVEGDVISGAAVPGTDPDEHKARLEEAGSWDAEDHVIGEGNFHDPALQGAGTILPDGSYGPPLPDPQVQRKNADPDYQVK